MGKKLLIAYLKNLLLLGVFFCYDKSIMEHIAIMKKSWKLTDKILRGEKIIESRWYVTKRKPWNNIKRGETIYFKDSGEPITLKTEVGSVIQFDNLNPRKVLAILKKYGRDDGIENDTIAEFYQIFKNKKYCILIYLKNPSTIPPFEINKAGFGAMSAWLTVDRVSKIKV
jgi:hypothetical protein